MYDTYGSGGWLVMGGTSVASPLVAGIYAISREPSQPEPLLLRDRVVLRRHLRLDGELRHVPLQRGIGLRRRHGQRNAGRSSTRQ